MNKQEALKRIEVQRETLIRLTGWAVYVYIEELIKSLDESEKIKIPQYTVVIKETKQPLYYNAGENKLFFSLGGLATKFTRKQLEDADFGWVFDCPGIEIEEVG